MNKYHQEILGEIKKISGDKTPTNYGSNYSGSSHLRYVLSVPQTRLITKDWILKHKDISYEELLELLTSLYRAKSTDEKKIAGQMLQYLPKQRSQISPDFLKGWLEQLEGWEEIDSLCQSTFSFKDLLGNWLEWERVLRELSESDNLVFKRASLVLLTGPVNNSEDTNLANTAFENIGKLKGEKSILITKAISWLLRELIKNHKERVAKYLDDNVDSLPKIAIRETKNKLQKGKK